MKKPKRKKPAPKAAHRPAVAKPKLPGRAARVYPPLPSIKGIRSIEIIQEKGAPRKLIVKIAPHYLVVITGGPKPTVGLSCTHHGFVAEAFELNGQLEQVINHVRKHFPKLRVD